MAEVARSQLVEGQPASGWWPNYTWSKKNYAVGVICPSPLKGDGSRASYAGTSITTRSRATLRRWSSSVFRQRAIGSGLFDDAASVAGGAQLEADLQAARTQAAALDAELGSVRAALESERRKSKELERTLADKAALSGAAQDSSPPAQRELEQTIAQMRQKLAERVHEVC